MKRRVLPLLLAVLLSSASSLTAQFVWTGTSLFNGSTSDLLNWQVNFPLVPTGSGSEDLNFGNLGVLGTQTNPLLPTIALRNFNFNGNNRPEYTFSGLGGTQTVTLNGNITANSGGANNNSITFDGSLNLALSNGTHTLNISDVFLYVFSNISESGGAASFVKVGDGSVYLAGNNTFSGGLTINAGAVFLNGLTSSAGTGLITLHSGAELWPFNGATVLSNNVSLNGGTSIFDSIGTTDVLVLNGTVSGSGSLLKKGPGGLTLTGPNTYSGGTTIDAGKILASNNSALGSNTVTLNGGTLEIGTGITLPNTISFNSGGGTLSGIGTFGSPITIGAFGTLSPGLPVGTLSFASGLTLAPSGTLTFSVNSATGLAGTGYDLLSISGAVLNISATSGSTFTISVISLDGNGNNGAVSDFSSSTPYSWTFATSTAGITNFAANKFFIDTSGFANGLGGGSFSVSATANNLNLNFTPVPEPSTYVLMVLGLGVAAIGFRRRRA